MASDETLTADEAAALEELLFELSAPHTQEEIAERLGLERYEVARIERRALAKMRELIADGWKGPLREPPSLGLRMGEPIASNGAATTPWSDGGQHDG